MTATPDHFDRYKRWRCREWLQFVRSLPCCCGDPRCPNCSGRGNPTRVVAAHLRNRSGIGVKPDDFMAYPLSDHIHQVFHREGHPSVEWQLDKLTETIRQGLRHGVIKIDEFNDAIMPF